MSFERASQQETIKSSNGQQSKSGRTLLEKKISNNNREYETVHRNTGGSFHSYLSSRRCTFSPFY
ncbi:hypothetical protein ISN45_At03g013630 [Arabidopsis thaliana x Arabidopsis arenosa]|uniref:Uncharacterized protein n=2 Tax=Arabidopsis TaxID=3701 RepID=A0A8T2F6V7_ARASU|nr:hypothetical protein ISN45_At03g013630 [Arabidopsis thaliana x Arabidopsis arenosa]KAG7631116.1 hypothetical protein ISN44_As03g013700 [Arabidopsis suecica]